MSFETPNFPLPPEKPKEKIKYPRQIELDNSLRPKEDESAEDKKKWREEFERHGKEMDAKQKEVRPEIEAKFKNALESLHTKIQSIQKPDKKFPSRDALGKLLEEIPVFAQMQEGAKKLLLNSLEIHKEFKSPNPQIFVAKGMELLGFFIDLAAMKKGGDLWLQERMEKREGKSDK